MSRRSKTLRAAERDGSSQASRRLAALAPGYVSVDERGPAELLAFVQAYARRLRYFDSSDQAAGDWRALLAHEELGLDEIVAYLRDPGRFEGSDARWLSRPHLALLLTFIELLGHAREQLDGLSERHLDYYYEQVLGLRRRPARPDHAVVLVDLAPGVESLRLPAGTELQAGLDSAGKPRIYRSERDLFANTASVGELRSVFVDFERTTLEALTRDRDLSEPERFTAMLELALGERPGEPVPTLDDAAVDVDYVADRRALLEFCEGSLHLEHHELRTIMRLRARRGPAADGEWARINELLGVEDPADPRDFDANLEAVAGALDFDGLPQVETIDDLYDLRERPDVAEFIAAELSFGRDKFAELMAIKRRIDGEWDEINRLLERAGRRQRGLLAFDLRGAGPDYEPTNFDANFERALGEGWPPPWPEGSEDLDGYVARLRALEAHLATDAEWLLRMVEIADRAKAQSAREADWRQLASLLAEAHRERSLARRRQTIAEHRAEAGLEGSAALEASACFILELDEGSLDWPALLGRIGEFVEPSQVDTLDRFHAQLDDVHAAKLLDWDDADRVLELAWRQRTNFRPPPAETIEWRNLYAHEDASAELVDSGSDTPRWRTFGQRRPLAVEGETPAPVLGAALRSPLLALRSGQRSVQLCFGFEAAGFDGDRLRQALEDDALLVEISTDKGWVEVEVAEFSVAPGSPGDDYWSLFAGTRDADEDRPGLRLTLTASPELDAFAPAADSGERWPALRLMLRQLWDEATASYRTAYAAFADLHLAALHLRVEVESLADLRLRSDTRRLDPKQPFEAFGRDPAAGARLYFSHPELVLGRLERLVLNIEWMGLPEDLLANYANYPAIDALGDFQASVVLVDQRLELPLRGGAALFTSAEGQTADQRALEIGDLPAAVDEASPGYAYAPRLDVPEQGDLRDAPRLFYLELGPGDFGHADYPILSTRKSRELAAALARGDDLSAEGAMDAYEVRPPYTPKIKRLRADYSAALELRFDGARELGTTGEDALVHIHPFGVCPSPAVEDPERGLRGPRLMPSYTHAGELYVALDGLALPKRLSLLVQLAEGSADPDLEAPAVEWSVLDGDRWLALDDRITHDSTRGLINSGIIEFELLPTAPSTRMPAGPTWLRAAVARHPDSVCDTLALHTQAVEVVFDDRGNAPDHYAEPLPVDSIDRLVQPRAEITAVRQPYTSFGGRPRESAASFHTRVSERLRHKQRALTPWDYEHLVLERFSQIYKAKCLRSRGDGRVRVIVIPDIRRQLPRDPFAPKAPTSLLAEIEAELRELSPDHVRVEVRNPQYVAVMVRLGVRFAAGVDASWAQRELVRDLNRYLSPWAYDEGAELSIGGRIYANSIIDFVDRRDYIDYIAELKLFRSFDGEDFHLVVGQPGEGDFVGAEHDDQILVAARDHQIDIITERYEQEAFSGLGYMKLELDFIVG